MFDQAFPSYLREDVQVISAYLAQTVMGSKANVSERYKTMVLLNDEVIQFPYRLYFNDEFEHFSKKLSKEQRCIYHCLYTRHRDGFVREQHVVALMSEYPDELPDWVCAYLLSVSGEYVIEILEVLYTALFSRNNETLKAMSVWNLQRFLSIHDRMISYWNEFYRDRCFFYKNYIGKKLFEHCYGYTRSMEKKRLPREE